MDTSITAEAFLDRLPSPQAEVVIRGVPREVAALTIWRTAHGVTQEVRGAIRAAVVDSLARPDLEVPFGVPVQYRAELFSLLGISLGFTATTTTQVDSADTWVHNVLMPAGATRVQLRAKSARTISRPSRGTVVRIPGREAGVLIGAGRQGVTGVDLSVITDTVDAADRIQAMLGSEQNSAPAVLCFRLGAHEFTRLPQPFYAGVLDIVEEDVSASIGGGMMYQTMVGDEVAPPLPGLFISLLTRAHLNAYYGTRAALNADNASRLSVNRRYDLVR
ncbi:hypothetical protein [Mycetocola spongiae]|uniref:hypothetical protein n=1 Tax=Mycetocola spongiae TaxID=2859226 RepID=UPI001CF4E063|nr:hypothetical protein [Mycetocola spongiae]UCR89243.1 hypothetical protein KXZ72_00575 [Mycetocola spongiae]